MAIDTTKPLVLMGGAPSLERTMKETGYDPNGAVLTAGGIPQYVDGKIEPLQTSIDNLTNTVEQMKTIDVVIGPSSFSSSAPYTYTVSISWMTSDWVPQSLAVSGWSGISASNIIKLQEFLGCIGMVETLNGSIKITAPETKPDWGTSSWTVHLRIQFTLIKEWVN